jgi:hypothetical protein
VFVTYPSERGVWLDASGNAIGLGTPAAFVGTNITGTASGLSIGGNAATATTASAATGPLNGTLGATTPSSVVATTLTTTGNATLGDSTSADSHTVNGATSIAVSSASTALTITQTGTGNVFVVEDAASPDSTPFVIDSAGNVISGTSTPTVAANSANGLATTPTVQTNGLAAGSSALGAVAWFSSGAQSPSLMLAKSNSGTMGTHTSVVSGNLLGQVSFQGSDGTGFIRAAAITAAVDGTPATNNMPGRLVFSTTADGSAIPTERMRIDSKGNVGIGGTASSNRKVQLSGATADASSNFTFGLMNQLTVASDADGAKYGAFATTLSTSAAAFTLPNASHFTAAQGVIGATSSVTNQYGFEAQASLTGATNNYGFFGNIPSGTGRYNIYMNGTADNYLAGNLGIGGVIPAASLSISKIVTGGITSYGVVSNGQVQSDVTNNVYQYLSQSVTQATAFTLNNFVHFGAGGATIGAGSAITNQFGFQALSSLIGATINHGFRSENAAAITAGKTHYAFSTNQNIATGGGTTWGFYSSGTANNAFNGNSSFGKVTAPTTAVDTTSFAMSLVTNTGATYAVLTTDSTIIQTTAASTYTLPTASSFTGRILHLVTQFAGTVISDSSNVVPIAGGAAGTAILAATAGKYAKLQSNGTNWIIIEAN